ncbi:hypothetical protein LTR09_009442 [Extremus antarcticus]|uniref:Cryptic loci regulator 2 N-terminal domain-containing protein n=1 Tax=Extremus antarcticus TaxID=702011 RepID=A0AAJ0G5N3_9PEZI|nr:hypothetical protein LTR09_009442 [Extremus antarcticus]
MSENVIILSINPGSDGDGRKWPKHTLTRNDSYFLEKVATEKWAHDLPAGRQPGVTYRLDRLPQGYAGFEKTRADGVHVDRYVYGHPNGQFRSLAEFYPHFKHLMDYGGANGCECKLCLGLGKGAKTKSGSGGSGSERRTVRTRPAAKKGFSVPGKRRDQSDSDSQRPQKRKATDMEGVPDVYEMLIEKLKTAGPEGSVDEPIEERMSLDWRTGNSMSSALLREWRSLPRYVPRVGEVVIFIRKLNDGEVIAWNEQAECFWRYETDSQKWLGHPRWEAGVVTQMPEEPTLDQDLLDDIGKALAVNDSGYRIEPMSKPSDEHKPYSKQSKYVPLHHIRPFALWSEYLTGLNQPEWHPTITHALTIASSFCVIGKYRFKGQWPHATVFARGVYIGPELIMVGDTIRLCPRKQEQKEDDVTDVMVVSAIRLRFVNLDLDDTAIVTPPPDSPYQTCLHISGRAYTLDPTRSFDGFGKVPIDASQLPAGLSGYGQWYHYHDPKQPATKLEVPYTRVLGRCYEDLAMQTWFAGPEELSTKSFPSKTVDTESADITPGLESVTIARDYSQRKDARITSRQGGKKWFWADTRIEQLDLHEVNNRLVGEKDLERNKGQMAMWKASLKALDGKKIGIEEGQAVQRVKQQEAEEVSKMQSSYGIVAAAAGEVEGEGMDEQAEDGGEEEEGESGDDMDINEEEAEDTKPSMGMMGALRAGYGAATRPTEFIEDSEDDETTQLAGKLAMSIRNDGARMGR